uniref:Large ribosomal subunit protein eL30 n=1 Tax=Catagonus wagneri TaxID=51154 RepID=A0A8C3VE33_9CETA
SILTKGTQQTLELQINPRFQLLMKSGKYMLRHMQVLKMMRQGKVKLVILTNNCSALRKSERQYYAMLAKSGIQSRNNAELGIAYRKYHKICKTAITDSGDSDIIRYMPKQTGEK